MAAILFALSALLSCARATTPARPPAAAARAGFRLDATYTDYTGRPTGARWVREATGMPLHLFGMDTVPQAALWVEALPESARGEAHALEHVLLGKGTTGRSNDLLTDMRLGGDLAATFSDFTYYQFHSSGNTGAFYEQLRSLLRALFKSDASDEEIRREVYHWGLSGDQLVEKGAVYNEIADGEGRDIAFWTMMSQLFGPDHPLARPLGGDAQAMRGQTPEQVRAFQKEHYRLGPGTPLVIVLPAAELHGPKLGATLARIAAALAPFEQGTGLAPARAPPPRPAPDHETRFTEYPAKSRDDAADVLFGWAPMSGATLATRHALEHFLPVFTEQVLQPALVESATLELETGATSVGLGVTRSYAIPFAEGFVGGIPSSHVTAKLVGSIVALFRGKLAQVAGWADGSPELLELNGKVLAELARSERANRAVFGNPPYFAIAGSGTAWKEEWKDRLTDLERLGGPTRNLTFNPLRAELRAGIASGRNIWRRYLSEAHLLDAPYVSVALASPERLETLARERRAREEAARAKIGDLEAFRRADEAIEQGLRAIGRKVAPIAFTEQPPRSFDDTIRFRRSTLDGGLALTESVFETSPAIHFGLAFDLRSVPRELLLYVPLLSELFFELGLKEGAAVTDHRALRALLDADVLELDAGLSTDPARDVYELVFRASGFDARELAAAFRYLARGARAAYLDAANVQRLQDVIGERLAGEDSYLRGEEHEWLEPLAENARYDDRPLQLATGAFFTAQNSLHRLQWRLTAPLGAAELAKLRESLRRTFERARAGSLEDAAARLRADDSGVPGEKALREYLAGQLRFMPPKGFAPVLERLIDEAVVDAGYGAERAVSDLRRLRDLVLLHAPARAWLTAGSKGLGAARTLVRRLLAGAFPGRSSWSAKAAPPLAARAEPLIAASLRARGASLDSRPPVRLGLVNPDGTSTSILARAPAPGYERHDRAALVELLGDELFSGRGQHSVFSRMWSTGLCYSNGLNVEPERGELLYSAVRCPSPVAALRFAAGLAGDVDSMHEPALVDYALSTAFQLSREAESYEARGAAQAEDLAYGPSARELRAFTKSLLALRRDPRLLEQMRRAAAAAFSKVIDAAGGDPGKASSVFLFVGPEAQLAELDAFVGPKAAITRIYPSDFWMD